MFRQDKDEDDEFQVGNESCCWQRGPSDVSQAPRAAFFRYFCTRREQRALNAAFLNCLHRSALKSSPDHWGPFPLLPEMKAGLCTGALVLQEPLASAFIPRAGSVLLSPFLTPSQGQGTLCALLPEFPALLPPCILAVAMGIPGFARIQGSLGAGGCPWFQHHPLPCSSESRRLLRVPSVPWKCRSFGMW